MNESNDYHSHNKNPIDYSYIFNTKYIDTNYDFIISSINEYYHDLNDNKIVIIGKNLDPLVNKILKSASMLDVNYYPIDTNAQLEIFIETIKESGKFNTVITHQSLINYDNKEEMIELFYKILTNNGNLMMIENCWGNGANLNETFIQYTKNKFYNLYNMFTYAGILDKCNFINIRTKDNVGIIINTTGEEYDMLESNKEFFIEKYGEKFYNKMLILWEKKKTWLNERCICWGFITAQKLI